MIELYMNEEDLDRGDAVMIAILGREIRAAREQIKRLRAAQKVACFYGFVSDHEVTLKFGEVLEVCGDSSRTHNGDLRRVPGAQALKPRTEPGGS